MNLSYPNHYISPAKKDKAWILKFGNYIYSTHRTHGHGLGYFARARYDRNLLYAQGSQDTDQYKDIINGREENEGRTSFININWQIMNVATRFVNIIRDKLSKVGYEIEVQAVDKTAFDRRNDYQARMKTAMEIRKLLESVGVTPTDADGNPLPEIPFDNDDLDLDMMLNYKDKFAMDAEMALQWISDYNESKLLYEQMDRDLITFGLCGLRVYLDEKKLPRYREVNPYNLIVSDVGDERFKNLSFAGEVITYTLPELRALAGDEISAEEYTRIEESFTALTNEHGSDHLGERGRMYDTTPKVRVLDFCFKSENSEWYEKVENGEKKRLYKKPFGFDYSKEKGPKDHRKIIKTSYEVVYEGKLILSCYSGEKEKPLTKDKDHEYIGWGCGLVSNIQRIKDDPYKVKLPYILYAPNVVEDNVQSTIEEMIPALDMLQQVWLKLQQELMDAKPKGAAIDLDALEAIMLGGDGSRTWTKKDLIDLFMQKNVVLYRGSRLSTGRKPIEELAGGLSDSFVGYANAINLAMNQLRSIVGINELADGTGNPNRVSTDTVRMSIESSDSALSQLFKAKKYIREEAAKVSIDLLQDAAKYQEIEGAVSMKEAIGESSVKFFKLNKDFSYGKLGLRVSNTPTEADWANFNGLLQGAYERGMIELEDLLLLQEMENLKQARKLFALKFKKRRRERMEEQQAMSQQNAQVQMQSAQQAAQMEAQVMQLKTELEKDMKLAVEQIKGEYAMQLANFKETQKTQRESLK